MRGRWESEGARVFIMPRLQGEAITMLLRHSTYYLLARGVPGLVNVAALALFTRLLAPDEFGRYALVLAGVGLANVVVFQWLRLVMIRFFQANRKNMESFLAGILGLFLTLAVAVTGSGVLLGLLWPDPVWQRLLVLAVLLLFAQAWFELNLSIVQVKMMPGWYGKLLGSKAMLSLVIGGTLAWFGVGAAAPIIGLIVAHSGAFVLFALFFWRGISPRWPNNEALREQLRYGLPLTVTFALAWVVSGSDRLLIGWLIDEHAVGVYAAAYDLSFQGLTLLLTIINTAAYPLALNVLEKEGAVEARKQLAQNGELIISAALAGAVGFVVLGPQIITLLIGAEFRPEALRIFPWVAVASALAGIKAYHFDIAFHLGRDSRWLVFTGGLAAITNLIFNLLLIPPFGILGAAWATLGAFSVAIILSAWLGRYVFAMPAILPLFVKGSIITLTTGFLAWVGSRLSDVNLVSLGSGAFLGLTAVFVTSLTMNLCGLRTAIWNRCRVWLGAHGNT